MKPKVLASRFAKGKVLSFSSIRKTKRKLRFASTLEAISLKELLVLCAVFSSLFGVFVSQRIISSLLAKAIAEHRYNVYSIVPRNYSQTLSITHDKEKFASGNNLKQLKAWEGAVNLPQWIKGEGLSYESG